MKADSLLADGPYRWLRNPLYFANLLLVIGMGSMMSRAGFGVAMAAVLIVCWRLILREEAEFSASQGLCYAGYCRAVPRLWPALCPRVAASGRTARWASGFVAEAWFWGFPAAVAAFAITLSLKWFFGILAASLALFWISPRSRFARFS